MPYNQSVGKINFRKAPLEHSVYVRRARKRKGREHMKSQWRRGLLTICVSAAGMLGVSSASFAMGLPDPIHYDMGVLGNWDLTGGISGFAALWNNDIPRTA